jgi:hypothetical protein
MTIGMDQARIEFTNWQLIGFAKSLQVWIPDLRNQIDVTCEVDN